MGRVTSRAALARLALGALVVASLACSTAASTTSGTEPLPIASANVCIDVPAALVARTAHDEAGYVDVLVGAAGVDPCVLGIEVYGPSAPDRPRTLDDLRSSLETDHAPSYEVTAHATRAERGGRALVTATAHNRDNGLTQRQWAFFLEGDAVVLSFYARQSIDACESFEQTVLSTIRTGHCGG